MSALEQCERALRVFLLDPRISAWLRANDPKAMEQAQRAVDAAAAEGIDPWNNPIDRR